MSKRGKKMRNVSSTPYAFTKGGVREREHTEDYMKGIVHRTTTRLLQILQHTLQRHRKIAGVVNAWANRGRARAPLRKALECSLDRLQQN